jgi:hypothetical protein
MIICFFLPAQLLPSLTGFLPRIRFVFNTEDRILAHSSPWRIEASLNFRFNSLRLTLQALNLPAKYFTSPPHPGWKDPSAARIAPPAPDWPGAAW